MYYTPGLWFYLAAGLAVAIMFLGFVSKLGIWLKGKGRDRRPVDRPRLYFALAKQIFLQPGLLSVSRVRWLIHLAVFYGFFGLFLHTSFLFLLDDFLARDSSVARFFYSGPGRGFLDVWGDVWGLLLLVGLAGAFLRRVFSRDGVVDNSEEDVFAVLLLLLVCLSGFMMEGLRIAADPSLSSGCSFLGRLVGGLFGSSFAERFHGFFLFIHIVLSLFFIAYLPFGKLIHIVATPLEAALEEASGESVE